MLPLTVSVAPESSVLPLRLAPLPSVKLPAWKRTRPVPEPLKLPVLEPVLPPFKLSVPVLACTAPSLLNGTPIVVVPVPALLRNLPVVALCTGPPPPLRIPFPSLLALKVPAFSMFDVSNM